MLPPTSTICPPLPLVTGWVVLFWDGEGAGTGCADVEPEPFVFCRVELSVNEKPPPCCTWAPEPPEPAAGCGDDAPVWVPPPAQPKRRRNAIMAKTNAVFIC